MRYLFPLTLLALCLGCSSDEKDDEVVVNIPEVAVQQRDASKLVVATDALLERYLKNGVYAVSLRENGAPISTFVVDSKRQQDDALVQKSDRFVFKDNMLLLAKDSSVEDPSGPREIKRWQREPDGSLTKLSSIFPEVSQHHIAGVFGSYEQLMVLSTSGSLPNFRPEESISFGKEFSANTTSVRRLINGEEVMSLTWQGNLRNSVMTENGLLIVSQYTPEPTGYLRGATTDAAKLANRQLIEAMTLTDLMPKLLLDGNTSTPLFNADACLIPESADTKNGYPEVLVLTSISNDQPAVVQHSCLVTPMSQYVYLTSEHLYLAGSFQESTNTVKTTIHQFNTVQSGVVNQASITLDGYLNIFRNRAPFYAVEGGVGVLLFDTISGVLGNGEQSNGENYRFVVLQQNGNALEAVSTLPSSASDEQMIADGAYLGADWLNGLLYVKTLINTNVESAVIDVTDPMQLALRSSSAISIEYSPNGFYVVKSAHKTLLQFVEASANNNYTQTLNAYNVSANDIVLSDAETITNGDAYLVTVKQLSDMTSRVMLPFYVVAEDSSGLKLYDVDQNSVIQFAGEFININTEAGRRSWKRSLLIDDDVYYMLGNSVFHHKWQGGVFQAEYQ